MSEGSSHVISSPGGEDDSGDPLGVTLEANRELRIKLFTGEVVQWYPFCDESVLIQYPQIALGWVWLVPAFHMSLDSPSSTLVLSNDDIDFAIGIGKTLVDLEISFVWHPCREGL